MRMMKMKRSSKRKRSVILELAVIAAAVYVIVSLVQLQAQIGEASQKCDEVSEAYENQQLENRELQRLLESGNEEEYIERVAREQLGFVKPDEKVFYDVAGN